jgi:hypothetical protein
MPIVRVVQVAVDQVIDVVAMRHCLVATAGAVNVVGSMAGAGVARRTYRRIRRIAGDHMLVDVVAMDVVQVAIMQVVDVVIVLDRRVAAAGPMDVGMVGMGGAFHGRVSGGFRKSLGPVSGG